MNRIDAKRRWRVAAMAVVAMMMLTVGGCSSPIKTLAKLPVKLSAKVRKHAPLPLALSLAAAEGVAEKVIIPGLP